MLCYHYPPLRPLRADNVLVLRLGDPAFTATLASGTLPAFPAYPTYWDEITPDGVIVRTSVNHRDTSGGQVPCTLGVGVERWLYDTDGLPSNSADGLLAIAPCFTVPVGSYIGAGLDRAKTITVMRSSGAATEVGLVLAYNSSYSLGGIRQAATVDGSRYWLSGMGGLDWGFRTFTVGGGYSTSVSGNDPTGPGASCARDGSRRDRMPGCDVRG